MTPWSRLRASIRSEDANAVWLGMLLLGLAVTGTIISPPPVRWATDAQAWALAEGQRPAIDALRRQNPIRDANLVVALSVTYNAITARERRALDKFLPLLEYNARNTRTASDVQAALTIRRALAPVSQGPAALFWPQNLRKWGMAGALLLVAGTIAVGGMGGRAVGFALGFPLLFALAAGALLLGNNSLSAAWGLQSALWALGLGTLGNWLRLPRILVAAVRPGYYLQAGVVLLGASMLLGDIPAIGIPAMVLACAGSLVVWGACRWLGHRLGLARPFAGVLASVVSLGGVASAVVAGTALRDRRALVHGAIIASLLAVPTFLAQAAIARGMHLSEMVTGTWVGGVLGPGGWADAAAPLLSEPALTAAAIVATAHTILIGLAMVWLAMRTATAPGERRPSPVVVAFVGVAVLASFGPLSHRLASAREVIVWLRSVCFALGFVSLGLELRGGGLLSLHGARAVGTSLGAQVVNLAVTGALAWALFGGALLARPTLFGVRDQGAAPEAPQEAIEGAPLRRWVVPARCP